jgi:hypothetical protein
LLAPWLGGAGSDTAPAGTGRRSLLAPWIGGAASGAGQAAGYASMLARWIGGASTGAGVYEPPLPSPGPVFRVRVPAFAVWDARTRDEDDLLLALCAAVYAASRGRP